MIGQGPDIIKALPGRKIRHGIVLGKFMPPTEGHLYLLRFALESCEKLTIVVGTLPDEPIPGHLRYEWIREIFPAAQVVHLDKVMPQAPAHAEDLPFFNLWADTLLACCGGERSDALFASEDYGYKVADAMHIRFIPVDTARESVGISGTEMRAEPFRHWHHLHPVIRPYYLKRIAVLGTAPEKAALVQGLAQHFATKYVADYREKLLADYARNIQAFDESKLTPQDVETMARGQLAGEEGLARQSNRLLFTSLDLRSLGDWGRKRFGSIAPWIEDAAKDQDYALYLLPPDAGAGWWDAAPPANLVALRSMDFADAAEIITRHIPALKSL